MQNIGVLPLTALITSSFIRSNPTRPDELSQIIRDVHRTLSGLANQAEIANPDQSEAARSSNEAPNGMLKADLATHDTLFCGLCDFSGSVLKRHLKVAHGLTPGEYRRRLGLPADHPTTAAAYSETRSALAKDMGLGRPGGTRNAWRAG